MLTVLSQIASRFRARVGESLTTVERHNTPLVEATTPSLEALKAYSTAWKVFSSTGETAALPFYQRAVEIDPQFAIAYAWLGDMYGQMGESDLSAENISKAYQLQDRASDAEKFFINTDYDIRVTGNLEKAEQSCLAWAQTYPRQMLPHGLLAGVIYMGLGRYEDAVEQNIKAIELEPDAAIVYDSLADNYIFLNRLDEAENALLTGERKLGPAGFSLTSYDIAFLKGDQAGMVRETAKGRGKAEASISYREAFVQAYSGHLQQSRRLSQRASDLAQQSGRKESSALFQTGAALSEAFLGDATLAKQKALTALEFSRDREVEFGAAVALALLGDSSQSQIVANNLEKRFPEDTSVRFNYTPTLRALLALDRGEPAKAIDQLQIASPYELAAPRSLLHGHFGALYPIYVRGEAYLAAHRGVEAAAEFQKILDHRGIVGSDSIGALAHLQLGRAYALSGDTTRARSAYRDFLTLWKDADPDIPILKQAQAEYARL